MALPDYFFNAVGTALSFKNTGGDYGLTLTSVTNGNGRQSAKADLGANWARKYAVLFTSSVGSAATAGNEIELWWAPSTSATAGTDNPGALSGTDATFNSTPDEYKQQFVFVGSLVLSNGAGTAVQKQYFPLRPIARYGMFVVVNKSGQTLGSTASDHEVRLTPVPEGVFDTITG